jgi:hypothetical protein
MLACYLALLIHLASRTGVTIDEPSHLLSAVLYWSGEDTLEPRDMPPLIKIVGGWAAEWYGAPLPGASHHAWKSNHEWVVGNAMMDNLNHSRDVKRLFFFSRLPLLVFPVATALLIWWWARGLFTPLVGLAAALLFMVEPTALGHASLFKNDHAATFGYLLFWWTAWLFWRTPSLATAAWLGVGLSIAVMAKMSMLFLGGIAPLLVVGRCALLRQWKLAAGALAIVLLIPYAITAAASQFEMERLDAARIEESVINERLPRAVAAAAQVFRVVPVPARYWRGVVTLFSSNESGNVVYFLGENRPGGHWAYFALATLVKAPELLLLLIALGLAVSPVARFAILPGVLYAALASLSGLQYGLRLILPALPFGVIAAAAGVGWTMRQGRAVRMAGAAAVASLVVIAVWHFPFYISYFNAASGGPDNGLRYLSGSNLDWGQDIRVLAKLIRTGRFGKPRVCYFGAENVWAHFEHGKIEVIPPPWSKEWAKGNVMQPEPGYYAISATLLSGHLFLPEYRDYYREFRAMTPVAKAGYSIYIYEVK